MAGKPAATVGSMHTCPICGKNPHVGGPITGPGNPNVLFNGKPVAVMGDKCVCAGSVDTIVQGNPLILINGKPIVCVGDMTAHGGVITTGEPNIIITTSNPQPAIAPLSEIPFPEINAKDRLLGGTATTEEQEKQDQLKEESKKNGYLSDFDLSV